MNRKHTIRSRFIYGNILFLLVVFFLPYHGIQAQLQNNIWTMPSWYYRHSSNSFYSLPASADYSGAAALNTHNAMQDANGNLLFFIVDDAVYDRDGYLIDYLYYNSVAIRGTAEMVIVPDPGNCQRYYIIAAGRQNYAIGYSNKLPYYAVLDLSQPSNYYAGRYGVLEYTSWGTATSIAAMTSGFEVEPSKQGGVFIAASKLRSDNTRLVFISNGYGIYRYKISSTGFSYDSYFLPWGPSSFNQMSIRGEMELVELSNGNYRIAAPFLYEAVLYPSIIIRHAIFTADLDNSGTLVPGSNQLLFFQYTNTDIQRPHCHGLEFSPSGNILYITHDISSLHPNPFEYFDFANPGLGVQTLAIPSASNYASSQIEIGRNGKLYMATGNHFGILANPDVPAVGNFSTQNYPAGVSYSPNYEGVSTPDYNLKTYMMPDQIDGMDYQALFFSNPVCCMLNTKYNLTTWTASASGTWSPGVGNNPFGSASGIIYVKNELIIPAGLNITIQNMIFFFAPGAKLTVQRGNGLQPGGKLTINNTALMADNRCDPQAMWLGVQVHGYNSQNQTPTSTSQQGWFTMTNNSVIRDAHIGVLAGKVNTSATYPYPYLSSYDLSYTGGVVRATGSIFLNNRQDAEFRNYLAPSGANNLSYFSDCRFITSGLLKNPVYYPRYHIAMYSTKGINISGNEFRNYTPSLFLYYQQGYGIYSNNAQFNANARCTTFYLPCGGYQPNLFQDMYYGIYAYSSTGAQTFSASRNQFINNFYGIYSNGPDAATMLRNTFEVYRSSSPNKTFQTYGIYLNNCTGYRVEENNFSEYADPVAPAGGNTYGVIVNNSGNLHNEIYKNNFSNLRVGAQAQGLNGENYAYGDPNASNQGLQFRCNTFTGDLYQADIAITSGRIDYQQGYCLPSANPASASSPAGNRFSHSTFTPYNDISANASVLSFNYAHHADVVTTPLYYNSSIVTASQCASIIDPVYYSAASCTSRINDGIIIAEPELGPRSDSLQRAINHYQDRIDGGNREHLLGLIASAPVSVSLRALQDASPYLSDEVLLAYIGSGAPEEHIRSVITANSPVSETVISALLDRPFTRATRAAITEAQAGISAMSILRNELKAAGDQLTAVTDERIRLALNQPEGNGLPLVASILETQEGRVRMEQLYEVYLLMQEHQKAETLKQELIRRYGFDNYLAADAVLRQVQLGQTTGAEDQARQIATDAGDLYNRARGELLLALLHDSISPGIIEPLVYEAVKKPVAAPASNDTHTAPARLLVYPNPSDGHNITLELENGDYTRGALVQLFSSTGQLVRTWNLSADTRLVRFSATEMASGVYMIKLTAGEETISIQKLVIRR